MEKVKNVDHYQSSRIYFENVFGNDARIEYDTVYNGLKPYRDYLKFSIEGMDLSKYSMIWKLEQGVEYEISKPSIIRVPLYNRKLFLNINYNKFNKKVSISDQDGLLVQYTSVDRFERGVAVTLSPEIDSNNFKQIFYGREQIEWNLMDYQDLQSIDRFSLSSGKTIKVRRCDKIGEHLRFLMDGRIPAGTVLQANGRSIEYEIEEDIYSQDGLMWDEKGQLKFRTIKIFNKADGQGSALIVTDREVHGVLKDKDQNEIEYRTKRKKDEGIWVCLIDEGQDDDDPKDQSDRLDFFFQLYFSSPDKEVWESPFPKDKEKVRVLKVDAEEGRLLLERVPRNKYLYPPGSTYQLEVQKGAIEMLMRRPTPFHHPLLCLTRDDDAAWDQPSQAIEVMKWAFLTEADRLGCEQQRDFVLKGLSTKDFCLLDGPPGSGKTTAISELIVQLLLRGNRILLCASTHVAIDNVVEKLLHHYGKERMEEVVSPLRIGKEDNISDEVSQYSFDQRAEGMQKIVDDALRNQKIPEEEKQFYLTNLIIKTSNLVCGTTIGILQYPPFKKARRSNWDYVVPEFDYLIIDEASKTTFQEFLVPAINAKRWIIVGDDKQLSPSVDTTNLQLALSAGIQDREMERALLLYFELVYEPINAGKTRTGRFQVPPDFPRFLCVDSDQVLLDFIEIFYEKTKKRPGKGEGIDYPSLAIILPNSIQTDFDECESILIVKAKDAFNKVHDLYGMDTIMVSDSIYKGISAMIPPNRIKIGPMDDENIIHSYRHAHWANAIEKRYHDRYVYRTRTEYLEEYEQIRKELNRRLVKPWSKELAWRMKRVYEIRQAKSKKENDENYYRSSMLALLPEAHDFREDVEKTSSVVFPSIVSIMSEGNSYFGRTRHQKCVLRNGLPKDALKERYVQLVYQHRMHPDISKVSSHLFYDDEALKDVPQVIDRSNGGQGEREWIGNNYPGFVHRFQWYDMPATMPDSVVCKNINRAESQAIIAEIMKLSSWLKNNEFGGRKSLSDWSVYILTFYEAQRKYILGQITQKFERDDYRKERRYLIGELPVSVYTVDKVQGREADIVFLSMVQNKRIGFMDSPNRLNVAITRARYENVIFGDRSYFIRQNASQALKDVANAAGPINTISEEKTLRGSNF